MGIQILNLRMKVFLAVLFCGAALALPNGRSLRPEEHWRPAAARDLSKFTPRHALVNAKSSPAENSFVQLARAIRQSTQSKSSHKASNVDLQATCGIEEPPSKDRIVGGFEAQENQWPWQVALFIDIMAGAHNVRESSEPHRVEITSYNGWTHPNWDHNTLANDIALIELPSPMSFNDYIRPSCMPMAGDSADVGEMVTCTGWGKPSDSAGGISPVLRMVEDRHIISNSDCNAIYGIVGSGVVCIDTTGGKGTCNGDSGGPLNMKSSMKGAGDKWKQVGVVSFGASAGCEVGYPAGFTRTEYYLDWVCSETNGVGC